MKRIAIVLAICLAPISVAASEAFKRENLGGNLFAKHVSPVNSPVQRPSAPALGLRGFLKSSIVSAILSETSGSTEFNIQQIRITPSGRLGYQRMGVDVTIPVPFELAIKGGGDFRGNPAILDLPEANLWIGEASLLVQVNQNLGFFANGAGNVIQSFLGPRLGQLGGAIIPNRASEWRERRLEWWEIEGGATFTPWSPFTFIAGLRADHFDLVFGAARGLGSSSTGPFRNVNLVTTDLVSDLWIPYVGFGLLSASYRAYVIASPFAAADIKVFTRLTANVLPSYTFSGEGMVVLKKPAGFVEARLEYNARLLPQIHLGLWTKGSWLACRGLGTVEGKYNTNHPDLRATGQEGETMTFSRYNIAGGLALNLSF